MYGTFFYQSRTSELTWKFLSSNRCLRLSSLRHCVDEREGAKREELRLTTGEPLRNDALSDE